MAATPTNSPDTIAWPGVSYNTAGKGVSLWVGFSLLSSSSTSSLVVVGCFKLRLRLLIVEVGSGGLLWVAEAVAVVWPGCGGGSGCCCCCAARPGKYGGYGGSDCQQEDEEEDECWCDDGDNPDRRDAAARRRARWFHLGLAGRVEFDFLPKIFVLVGDGENGRVIRQISRRKQTQPTLGHFHLVMVHVPGWVA